MFLSDLDGGGCRAAARTWAAETDPARAHELTHTVGANQLFECLDFVGTPDELEGDRVSTDVGDACACNLAERDELGALVGLHGHGEQGELTLDGFVGQQL